MLNSVYLLTKRVIEMSQLDILGSCAYNDSNSGKMSHLKIILLCGSRRNSFNWKGEGKVMAHFPNPAKPNETHKTTNTTFR